MTCLRRPLKTSDLFVAALENENVEWIFAVPGKCLAQPPVILHVPSGAHS